MVNRASGNGVSGRGTLRHYPNQKRFMVTINYQSGTDEKTYSHRVRHVTCVTHELFMTYLRRIVGSKPDKARVKGDTFHSNNRLLTNT